MSSHIPSVKRKKYDNKVKAANGIYRDISPGFKMSAMIRLTNRNHETIKYHVYCFTEMLMESDRKR
ncbi:hypothetical protein LCGC14_1463540 [marine sediment metagenome]|uniref:Uncharacterized protein n=1 Tax=marine sediment metagenome TaxID=412755 RepID=A0A0F9LUZ1_9ZZZZ